MTPLLVTLCVLLDFVAVIITWQALRLAIIKMRMNSASHRLWSGGLTMQEYTLAARVSVPGLMLRLIVAALMIWVAKSIWPL